MHRLRSPAHVLAVLAALLGVATAPAAAARPNLVLILTDDQRWDTLAAMPTVERELVARGVTFMNAFAVNPLCCPSRASFLTGRYSHSTGVYDNRAPHGGASSFDDSSTLATWLASAGYRTAYVGKYLNGYRYRVVPRGWDRWFGFNGGFFDYWLSVDGIATFFGESAESYSTDVLTHEAISFIETTGDPFFLVYAPYAPHAPATPAPRHEGAFARVPAWRPPSYDELDVADKPGWLRGWPRLTDKDQAAGDALRRRQLASLVAVDEGVSAILASLRRSGRLENTVVVFASDNGLLWGEHRQWNWKVSAFEESIRIPLVVRYDALSSGGRRASRLVANIDVAPTLAELAGTAAPGAEGVSLVPLLSNPPAIPRRLRRRFLLVEHLRGRNHGTAEIPSYCAVRGTRFKYVVYSTREEELYDLAADRFELENRARDPGLRSTLFALRREVKRRCDPPPPGFGLGWLCTLEPGGAGRVLVGTKGMDTICGGPRADRIRARAGDDVVRAGGGADVV
ncbi:MAG: sulfatase-like hydrolase/transferase, partial [Actinomycetota bacterium]|nr:sulfatase-like hydrolase/transferase [Actinomycetota bacterium]